MRTDIWAWWPDGRTLPLSPGDGAYLQACVHPSGERAVLWGGPPEARPRLWSSPTDRSEPVALTAPDVGARHGTFGLRGDRIAFSSDLAHDGSGTMADETPAGNPTAGHWNLFTMAPDGSDVRQVTDGAWVDQRPALSPDGATIAFVSDRAWGIWLVPADGSGEPTLLTEGQFLYRPAWSIDGSCLYAFRISPERRQAGAVDLATGAFTPFANDDRGNTHGPWADPSGDRLVVHSDRDGAWRLWELPLDGSPMRPLVPPGHEHDICAHGTRAANGVLTFDRAALSDLAS